MKKTLLLIAILFASIISYCQEKDNCSQVLIPDTKDLQLDLSLVRNTINIFKSNHIETYDDYKNFAGKAKFPIEGIPVEGSSDITADNFKQFKTDLYKYESLNQDNKTRVNEKVRKLSSYVVKAWKDCMTKVGVHAALSEGRNAHNIIISASEIGLKGAKVINISFSEPVVTKDGLITDSKLKLQTNKNSILRNSPNTQMFVRTNDNPIDITISVDYGTTEELKWSLDGISKPDVKKETKVLYKAVITKVDNALQIFAVTNGVQSEEKYNSSFNHPINLNDVVYLSWLKKEDKNEIKIIGINQYMQNPSVNENPYDFEVTIYEVKKINGELNSKPIYTFKKAGVDPGRNAVVHDNYPLIPIGIPDNYILVNSEVEL